MKPRPDRILARTLLLACSIACATDALAAELDSVPRPADAGTAADDASSELELSERKRLSEEDLAAKKEGTFVTGIPDISYDPLNGYGFGAEGFITFNGSRSDRLFAYTPYRSRLAVEALFTTGSQQLATIAWDVPYLFGTPWRLRAEVGFERNPNELYFGTTTKSLRPLRNQYPARSPYRGNPNDTFNDYEYYLATVRPGGPGEAPRVADNKYNYFEKREAILNVSMEYAFLGGRMRTVTGLEVAYLDIGHFDGDTVRARDPTTGQIVKVPNGRTLITEDEQAGRIVGARRGLVNIVQAGLVYDTRDLEPDPTRGVFAEITNELSVPAIGSKYSFDKVFTQAKGYLRVTKPGSMRVVLAGRLGAGYTIGAAPFFEYQDEWSSEGSIEALGGYNSLRGYKQSRFVGRIIGFANFEVRTRLFQFDVRHQRFGVSLAPFVGAGGVWDALNQLTWKNIRISEGAGLRVAWNQSTIIALDSALSEEDQQVFLQLGQAF